jgi:type II secretory pathway pseudopilin PulG
MKHRNVETSKRQNREPLERSPQQALRSAPGHFDVSMFRRFDVSPRRRSYTLIELLLVCAILGIAGALLIPRLVGRDIMACQSAVRLIIGDLSFTQADALAHQELRRVHFYDDGSGYCVLRITQGQLNQEFDPDTADYLFDPLLGGQYIVNFATDSRFEGVTIASVDIDGGGRDLHYDSMGGTINTAGGPGSGGTIRVNKGNETYDITISPFTGKLTVTKV